ncbi:envelope glycoprotein M [Cercopithecine alphaherpesvirus 9]|nr:envelope glycoprotein M [Cercopithecine alphaherpesvirus 9]
MDAPKSLRFSKKKPHEIVEDRQDVQSEMNVLSWRIWLTEALMFTLGAVMFLLAIIMASVEFTGLPCFYAAVVDYELFNATLDGGVWAGNKGYGAPVLFLEPRSILAFTYYKAVVMLAVAIYVIASAISIHRQGKNHYELRPCYNIARMIATPTTLFLGLFSLWLEHAVLILLAYKQVGIAGTVYVGQFITFVLFTGCFFGRGKISDVNDKELDIREYGNVLYRLVGPARAVFVNLVGALMSIDILITCLMLELVVANHSHLDLWSSVSTALSMFTVMSIIYLVVAELTVAHYVHVLIGPSLGTLISCATLGTAAHAYMDRLYDPITIQSPRLIQGTRGTLACLAVLSIVMLIVRVTRAYLYHRKKNSRFYGQVKRVPQKVRGYLQKFKSHRHSRYKYVDTRPLTYANLPRDNIPFEYSTYETDMDDDIYE